MFRPQININRLLMTGILFFSLFLLSDLTLNAQAERKHIRQGNREYSDNSFSESEISYRRALDINSNSPDALFNTGDALYRQNKFEEAGKQFIESSAKTDDKADKAASFYNLGNSLLMANRIGESIEAYKNSLKLDPGNMEAKYNLAYAQDLLQHQQQQQQQQQDNSEEQKNEQEQQKQDGNKQNNGQNQQQDQQEAEKQEQDGISKEDAERLLNAIANDEKDVQEKVKEAKAAAARVRVLKNW